MNVFIGKDFLQTKDLESRAGYDFWILLLTLGLCLCGATFVLTSSAAHSWSRHEGSSMLIFWSHLTKLGIGMIGLAIFAFTDYHRLERFARWLLLVGLLLLIVVLFVPQPQGSTAHRWIRVPGFGFQPAELAKFVLINYLAMRLASPHHDPFANDRKKIYQGSLIISGIILVLVVSEPNLSMALLVLGVVGVMLFLSGIRLRPLIIGGGIALPILSGLAWITPYMRTRLIDFVSGIVDPVKSGHQVKQSLVGIGHGGLAGLGLGASTQKYFFLPEPYKDFIFSIVGEELGLVGATALLILFVWFLGRGFRIARLAPDAFGYYLAMGITASIALSFSINVGVTLGLLPATGQPLPFISYGGSSIVMSLCAVGVLLNVSSQIQHDESAAHQLPTP